MTYKNMDLGSKIDTDLFLLEIDSSITEIFTTYYLKDRSKENYDRLIKNLKDNSWLKNSFSLLDNLELRLLESEN